MLYIFVIIALVFMLTVVIAQQLKHRELVEELEMVIEDKTSEVEKWIQDYAALEIGMDEQQENYEMQILSLQDMLGTHMLALYSAEDEVARHKAMCLPHLEELRAAKV